MGPRATTFSDTAAAAVGTTEKPTGRAECAGTSTCWASPPPPARHSPSTGATWTLSWGGGGRFSQAGGLFIPPRPPRRCAPGSRGPHGQVGVQIVVQDRPQLELLKAANGDGQAEVQVEFAEHSEPDWCGHTQACGARCGDGETSEAWGHRSHWEAG